MTDPFRSRKPVPPGFGGSYEKPISTKEDREAKNPAVSPITAAGNAINDALDLLSGNNHNEIQSRHIVTKNAMRDSTSMKRDAREIPHSALTPNESVEKVNKDIVAGRRSSSDELAASSYVHGKAQPKSKPPMGGRRF